MQTIVEQVFLYADSNPEKLALADGKRSMTYGELCRQILFAKDVLSHKYTLRTGDAVVLAANKQMSFVSVYFACHLLEIMVLPLAPDINDKRLNLIMSKTNPRLVVGLNRADIMCQTTDLKEFDGFVSDFQLSTLMFPDLQAIADIIFTTGTTGEPKGVTLTHQNIVAAAKNINTFVKNREDDVEMLALPISHSFGLGRLRCAISNGQTIVLLGSFANMKRFFRLADEFGVTGFGMVPASWSMIKKLSGMKIKEFAKQLRYIEIGSAPMPMEDKILLLENLPDTRICMHYGLTEASRSAFMEFHEEKDFLDTVGKQSPNMFIEIRDEEGNVLPCGEEGEICVKGEAVTKGYYHMPEVNAKSYWGEYFRTGDWGWLSEDGHIRLCSRKKELINVGGKKVSPLEIEEILIKKDFIDDCACIAIPDPDGVLGEVVKAYVVTKMPELIDKDALNRELSDVIESYKLPVEYEVIDEIPKTNSGKVQRLLLKK